MSNLILSANQWPKILAFIRECPRVYVGEEAGCNRFIAAVLWVMRSGGQWRQLPAQYGKWNTVYKRFARWCRYGVWERMHQHFMSDPDLACLIIDSMVVRAHACAAGASKKKGGQAAQALGKSRGGFSTKIHLCTDARGLPLRFRLTPGQTHDITQAEALIAGYESRSVIADKGYDSQAFLDVLSNHGQVAVIPPRSYRKTPRDYDRHRYKQRNLIERLIGKMKQYRRIFARFEKLSTSYRGFLAFAATLIALKQNVNRT